MAPPTPPIVTPRPPDWRLSSWAEPVLVGLVAAMLVLPGLGTMAGLDSEVARDAPAAAMAATGSTAAGDLSGFSRRFETHFAFRPRFVRWQAALRHTLLGVSPLPTVIRGRDGWWFYADDGALEEAANATPFTDRDLEVWRATLQRTADWLAARGIAYVFVVAPDKPAIYPEFLPVSLRRAAGPSRTDQLVAMLRARSTVTVVDLRQGLLEAKARGRVYHRTDSHWNDPGAAVAYRQIVEAVRAQAPAVPPAEPDAAFTVVARDIPGMDLAEMTGLTGLVTETSLTLVPVVPRVARIVEPVHPDSQFADGRIVTAIDRSALPRAVVYRDSFGSALVPFLAEHFSRTVFLWEYDVTPATVRAERPQVVIQEWAGRRLYTRLPYDAVTSDRGAPDETAFSSSPAARR